MSDVIGTPPINGTLPLDDAGTSVNWTPPWANWYAQAYRVLFAVSQSGTTAQRPTSDLYAGQMYFDKSLGANGKPIWRNKGNTGWVLADGTAA